MKSHSIKSANEIQKWYILERAPYLHMHTSIVQICRHLHMLVRLYEDQSKADMIRVGGKPLWIILCELHCHCQRTVWILFTSTTLCTQKSEHKVKCSTIVCVTSLSYCWSTCWSQEHAVCWNDGVAVSAWPSVKLTPNHQHDLLITLAAAWCWHCVVCSE